MEGDQEQVNITTIEPVTIERTGVIEQSEQEAVPVEEPLPLLRDVVDTASHEEHSMVLFILLYFHQVMKLIYKNSCFRKILEYLKERNLFILPKE